MHLRKTSSNWLITPFLGRLWRTSGKRYNIELVTDECKLVRLAARPTYISSKIFTDKNHIAVHRTKTVLSLNRPSYVGMCILDLSKTLMYDFHYNYIEKKYSEKARLLFTDTDSLCYEIEAEDIYKDFYADKDKFDNSDYPASHPYNFNNNNNKVTGKVKDETAGVPIVEFIGLRSKMHSYILDNEKNGKIAKGIKKAVIKKDVQHHDYKSVLLAAKQMSHKMKSIRSVNHELGSYEINKISLSCYDDKRYLLADGISSYAYGHYQI